MPVKTEQLQILCYPHPALRRQAAPIDPVDDEVRGVARRMVELMHEANGVGLAAPQVGLAWRLFVANPTGEPDDDRVYINPTLRQPTRETASVEEGCLSIPGVNGRVMRPVGVTLDALNADAEPITETSTELLARIWQHETDHLDGVLILDKMNPIDKRANRRAIQSLEETGTGS
jgi:peptide deformylase